MDVQSGVVNFVGSRKDLEEKLNTLVEKSAAQKFQIMVMGMFSSGKSSMINAFLGEKILAHKSTFRHSPDHGDQIRSQTQNYGLSQKERDSKRKSAVFHRSEGSEKNTV